jgi:hypothetical protein
VFLMMEAAGRKQGEVYLAVALQDHYSRQKGYLEFKKGQVLAGTATPPLLPGTSHLRFASSSPSIHSHGELLLGGGGRV